MRQAPWAAQDRKRLTALFAVIGTVEAEVGARCLGLSTDLVEEVIEGYASDEVSTDDTGQRTLRLPVARRAIADCSEEELQDVFGRVADLVLADTGSSEGLVLSLVDAGCDDDRVVDLLLELDARADVDDLNILARVRTVVLRKGWTPSELAVRRAQAMLAEDRIDRALTLCDDVIERGTGVSVEQAIEVAALCESRLGNLGRAVDLHEMSGEERERNLLPLAAAALGAGRVELLRELATESGVSALSRGSWSPLMTRGLLSTLDGPGAIHDLVHAADVARHAGRLLAGVPFTPATLAAAAAFGDGDPLSAERVLLQALESTACGRHGTASHLVGLGWTRMVTGDLDGAAEAVDRLMELAPRGPIQMMWLHGLRLGVARRASDSAALEGAWRMVRGGVPGLSVDLFTLPLIGELHVTACRVGDATRMDKQVARGLELLASLGNPSVWSTHFHWYGVQAAVLGQRPAMLAPHASGLVAAAETSEFAGVLADAGQTWVGLLRGDTDAERVGIAVERLAGAGMLWDATRLAGYAAARTGDPGLTQELMRLARSVDRRQLFADDDEAAPMSRQAGLSEREVQVSRLVLDGLGYREIGQRLFISPRTVEHHVARIRQRLDATDRQDLLAKLRAALGEG